MVFLSPCATLAIPKQNILSYIFPPGEELPDTPLWIDSSDNNNSLSLKQMSFWVRRIAIGFDKLGVKRGTVVMIYTPNHIFVPAAYLGIVGSGRIFSGTNPAYTLPEVVHQIRNTEARVILAHQDLLPRAIAAAKQAGLPSGSVFQFSDLRNPNCHGVQNWTDMVGSEEEAQSYKVREFSEKEACDTVASINYSSGTTGVPKGVCVSHFNLIANVEQTIHIRDLGKPYSPSARPAERWIGFLPLYHAYGQLYAILMASKLRNQIFIMKTFVYADFLSVIQDKKITHLQVAPPILVMLSKRPETAKYDLRSVTDVLCGAAPLSKELQNDVMERFGMQINQGWGMTEVTCGAIHMPGGIKDDSGSVGVLDSNCEAKLLDEDGKEVSIGERGELYIRGPQVCMGYWRNDEATKDSIDSEGWLKTGDVAICNDKGWFWIVDRKKELIKVNGLQVAPAELEAVLLEHPDVADAAVVGITLHDEEWPRAYIALKEPSKGQIDASHIHAFMKKRVAKHKLLVGGIAFVEEVPKLASGKIYRKQMREWAKRDVAVMEGQVKARL